MSGELTGLLSPFLRRRRIAAATPYLHGRLLDWGCGSGSLCEYVKFTSYVGVDLSDEVIVIARSKYNSAYASFYTLREFIDEEHVKFDTISALAVIEHLSSPVEFLQRMKLLLAPGGKIVLTTPNPMFDWLHGLGGYVGVFAQDSHGEHQSLMDRRSIEVHVRAAGLDIALYKRFLFGANQLVVLNGPIE